MKRGTLQLAALAVLTSSTGGFAQSGLTVDDLAPGVLLVAARELRDSNFVGSVVLLTAYSKTSAMGLILNRPTLTPLSRLFPTLEGKAGLAPIYEGGPVSLSGALALVQSKTKLEAGAQPVFQNTFLVSSKELLEKLVREPSAKDRVRVYAGYAGWGPGQLDREVEAGAWLIVRGMDGHVFDPNPDTLWQRLVKRATMRIARSFQLPCSGSSPGCLCRLGGSGSANDWTER
jgi:putative transcriptional regulator